MAQKNKTYVETYHKLIDNLQYSQFAHYIHVGVIFVFFCMLGVIIYNFDVDKFTEALSGKTLKVKVLSVFVSTLVLVGLPVTINTIVSYATSVWHSITPSETRAREMAARLLLSTPKPYHPQKQGLYLTDIKIIREIAETHQASADWRGNIVNLILLLAGLYAILPKLKKFYYVLSSNPQQIFPHELATFIELFYITLGIAFVIFISLRFFYYYRLFLRDETANRTILYACIEIEILLKKLNLEQVEAYSKHQKRILAGMLGLKSSPNEVKRKTLIFKDEIGYWYIKDEKFVLREFIMTHLVKSGWYNILMLGWKAIRWVWYTIAGLIKPVFERVKSKFN